MGQEVSGPHITPQGYSSVLPLFSTATHLFLNMERCGEETGGPDGDIPKASEC